MKLNWAEYIKYIITENVCFDFEKKTLKRIDGVTIRSHLGQNMADVFLGMVKQEVLDNILEFSLYRLYV